MTDQNNLVLFVDDETHILSAIRRAVVGNSFEALFAGSAKEALQLIQQHPVSVIVTDMKMPVMDGLTLLKIVRESHPQIIRMVLSGYTQLSQVLATVNQGDIFQFIPKPWQMEEELLVAVRQAIERFNLEAERDKLQESLAQKNQSYLNIFQSMEQKFINEKKDLNNIRRLNRWTFAFWKKHLEMCTEHVPETIENAGKHMDLIEDIQAMYLDILPIVQEERNLEQAFAGIVKACNNKVEIFKRQSENPQLPGYYGFLELVFKIIVQLQGTGSREVIPVSAILEPKEAGSCYVIFECPLLQETVTDQIRVKIACSMLNEIGEAYRLRLLLQTDPKGLASIRTVWHAILVGSGKP